MPTRRQVIEQALVSERIHLWTDLYQTLTTRDGVAAKDPTCDLVGDCIERIRVIGEALGYPTDWRSVPARALSWYEMVETAVELGLAPMVGHPVNFPAGENYLPIDDVIRKHHRYVHDGDDPDDFDFAR